MEFFNRAKAVRLRSHLDKFLIADEDEETVRQSRNGSSTRARWLVEWVQSDNHLIRLKSCYNKYLTASADAASMGLTGSKVLQTTPFSMKDPSVYWEPRTEGWRVKLKARSSGTFLRANGGSPLWRNTVTHGVPHRTVTQEWILWVVDVVDIVVDQLDIYSLNTSSSCTTSFDSSSLTETEEDYRGLDCTVSSSPSSFAYSCTENEFNRKSAMEIFQKASVVRLRSHHDKYLLADEDKESVSQDRDGTCRNARWTVEIIENSKAIRLNGCYGKYLTASNMPFLFGVTGKKVLQTLPRRLDSSVEWEPVREGMQVKLKTRSGQYLRANGGVPPWRNSITHDIPHRTSTQDWVLWEVDVLETKKKAPSTTTAIPTSKPIKPTTDHQPWERPSPPPPSKPIRTKENHQESEPSSPTERFSLKTPRISTLQSSDSFEESPVKVEGRLIYYEVADENGDVHEAPGEKSFIFKGKGLEELRQKLEEETRLSDVTVCARNPLNGNLYPLRLHLPPNNTTMYVVLVPSSSKVIA